MPRGVQKRSLDPNKRTIWISIADLECVPEMEEADYDQMVLQCFKVSNFEDAANSNIHRANAFDLLQALRAVLPYGTWKALQNIVVEDKKSLEGVINGEPVKKPAREICETKG